VDPRTAIVLLTLQLLLSGGLVALIARHNEGHRGLIAYAYGSALFGLAYLARMGLGLQSASTWALIPDVAMVLAGLLFLRGQRHFMAGDTGPLGPVLLLAGVYALAHVALALAAGQTARHFSLNAALATVYLALARSAWRGQRTLRPTEAAPLRVLAVVCSLLGSATALRAADAWLRGVDGLFAGPAAQGYYALSSVATLLLGPVILWWMFARLNQQLAELATRDPLTGLLNRNGLTQILERHFAARQAPTVVCLMADIDHFKRVNDTLGHTTGDRLLRAVAGAMQAQVRAADFVARVGGEEFLIGLTGVTQQQAMELAERLRAHLALLRLEGPAGQALQCTVSVGVSPTVAGADAWEAAWHSADQALYAAKAAGRNRVVAGEPLPAGAAPVGSAA
jgi:diguanylate cyclase (GGDEF)-like protein